MLPSNAIILPLLLLRLEYLQEYGKKTNLLQGLAQHPVLHIVT